MGAQGCPHLPGVGRGAPIFSFGTRRQQRIVWAPLAPIEVQKRRRRRAMKYMCFGYYDKSKFDGMTDGERNAMFDRCFEYDDHLRATGHWAGGEALQGPETAVNLYWNNGKLATT